MEAHVTPLALLAELKSLSAVEARLVGVVDAWCAEVLHHHATAIAPESVPDFQHWTLDDLVGSYLARDRVERITGAAETTAVRVADALLKSFTTDEGSSWVEEHGHIGKAGPGWWWSRVPVAGLVREEFQRSNTDEA